MKTLVSLLLALVVSCALQTVEAGEWRSIKMSGYDGPIKDLKIESVSYASGIDNIFKSTDQGETWISMTVPSGDYVSLAVSGSTVLAGGNNPFGKGVISKSTNNGATWFQYAVNGLEPLTDVCFFEGGGIIAVGGVGKVARSTDGGSTWDYSIIPGAGTLTVVTFSGELGWTSSYTGTLGKFFWTTTDRGQTWSGGNPFSGEGAGDLAIVGTKGFGVGGAINSPAKIYRTTDIGMPWQTSQYETGLFKKISFLNSLTGFAVGYNNAFHGIIYRTSDGGDSWQKEGQMNNLRLYAVSAYGESVQVGSDSGYIFSIPTVIGIQISGTEIPSGYHLDQNYPNPFNPSTSITFSLPQGSETRLEVFDIAGRKEVLFSGFLRAGRYTYDFHSNDLASGIYFYRLVTDKFTETKKMMLVK